MDLSRELLESPGPLWTEKLTSYVCQDQARFNHLINLFLNSESRLIQRSTLIILSSAREKPQWLQEKVGELVAALRVSLPVSLKRNILRILQDQEIPEPLWGHAADQCFQYLSAADEPVAVKVFSMTVIYNLSKKIPELGRELKILVEDQYPWSSAGFQARGRKVLAALSKDGH